MAGDRGVGTAYLTRMDHQLGRINLIRWQGRKTRRGAAGGSLWPLLIVTCAVFVGVIVAIQAAGWVHWTGPVAFVPAVLLVLILSAPLLAMGRAILTWFGD
jgi:hypothetical protein